ncbi:MAG: helix-turn-helix domain-containing protein [Gemmatimonadota bacterium]
MPFCNLTIRGSKWCGQPLLRTLGDHLRRRRAELQLKQRQVANLIGVHKDTIANWERNRTEPEIRYLPAIVDCLGHVPNIAGDDSPGSFRLAEAESGENLPARLRLARQRLGLSQRTLAERLCVDESSVWGWENGHHRPIRRHRERVEALVKSIAETGEPVVRSLV